MINKNIKTIRQSKGLTQKFVAQQLGMSPMQYYRIENGLTKVDANILPKLAEELGVKPAIFFKDSLTEIVSEEVKEG